MIKQCLQCEKEFEGRPNTKFCSEACKQKNKREKIMPGEEEIPVVTQETSEKINAKETQEEIKSGVSKKTGLSYDYSEKSSKLGTSKKKCPGCGEPTWLPPCATCNNEKRDKDPHWFEKLKAEGKWGEVCSLEAWIKYPNECETKAQARALQELYSNFTAKQLVEAGVKPPKWKERFATYQEAKEAAEAGLEELDLVQDDKGWWGKDGNIDYSKWK